MADTSKLKDAVEVLVEQLGEQEREVRETKKTINMLSRRMGEASISGYRGDAGLFGRSDS
jgi:hypothetical protein